jgi:hypothetical protein
MVATISCLLLLAGGHLSAGNLFEWVDQHGATHFSDRAPPGSPFMEKTVKPASGSAPQDYERGIRKAERLLLKKAEQRKSNIESARQAAVRQLEQRKSRCRQARSRYREASRQRGTAGRGAFKQYRRRMNAVCD